MIVLFKKSALMTMFAFFALCNVADARICFIVGGCNQQVVSTNCESLGYIKTEDVCESEGGADNGIARLIPGGSPCPSGSSEYYDQCVCNPAYYKYEKVADDGYEYFDECNGKYHVRTELCSHFSDGSIIVKPEDQSCGSGYSSSTEDYYVSDGTLTCNVCTPKRCSDYSMQEEECAEGYTQTRHDNMELGAISGTCYECVMSESETEEESESCSGISVAAGTSPTCGSGEEVEWLNDGKTCYQCVAASESCDGISVEFGRSPSCPTGKEVSWLNNRHTCYQCLYSACSGCGTRNCPADKICSWLNVQDPAVESKWHNESGLSYGTCTSRPYCQYIGFPKSSGAGSTILQGGDGTLGNGGGMLEHDKMIK